MQSSKKPASTSASSLNPELVAEGEGESIVSQRLKIFAPMPAFTSTDLNGLPSTAKAEEHVTHSTASRMQAPFHIARGRYRRTVTFFVLLFVRVIWWEVLVRRVLGNDFVSRGRSARFRRYARNFRKLATSMGGVMIKLGQFVSSRVDVLPPEITDELQGLQDQVPIVPFEYIKATVEQELGPLDAQFVWLNPEPVAAASFGQVHRAQLLNGDRVVVKVQRPHLDDIVKTDLSALHTVARLAMRYGPIRRRANVPELLDEFSRVLWEELDYLAEADNVMRFSSMFAEDKGIYIPSVYLPQSTRYVLTLEDVTSIKLNDYAALEQAGIDRHEVAERLLNCYLQQVFEQHFFHADPHPGNLFVYPLPDGANGAVRRAGKGKPFYLIFIDFGMVGRLTPRIQEGLRDTLISVITQDAKGLVASYRKLGVLMPDADEARIEAATEAVFKKVWGLNMSQLSTMPFEEMTDVAQEFSDLLLSMPFQMPQDFIYLSRAVGILSGMCTGLDPSFDPWRQMQPFTEKLLASQTAATSPLPSGPRALLEVGVKAIRDFANRAYRLPTLADSVLSRAERGDLTVQISANDALYKQVSRIESSVNRLSFGVIFATLVIASTVLITTGERTLGLIGYSLSMIILIILLMRPAD